jgi:hypothetical protein
MDIPMASEGRASMIDKIAEWQRQRAGMQQEPGVP